MAIISEHTLGDILYQEVDAIPTHSAPKGTRAIYTTASENPILFISADGAGNWGRRRASVSHGKMYYTGNTTNTDTDTIDTWFNNNARVYTAGTLDKFTVANTSELLLDALEGTGLFIIASHTTIEGNSGKSYDVEISPLVNNSIPPENTYSGSGTESGVISSIKSQKLAVLSGGDYINLGQRYTAEYGGGPFTGYILESNIIWAEKIFDYITQDLTISNGDFEAATNLANWTTANDTTNVWVAGTADPSTGTKSAYISNDAGVTNNYTNNVIQVSHLYKSIFFGPFNAKGFILTFDWKCVGEDGAGDDQYDYGRVFLGPGFGNNPVAGTQFDNLYRIGSIKYNDQATFTTESIVLPSSYAGGSFNLIFSWSNDGTVGVSPSFTIDNVKITALI